MRICHLENDSELQRALWACYSYWDGEPLPAQDRTICYKWVLRQTPFAGIFEVLLTIPWSLLALFALISPACACGILVSAARR